MQSHENSAPCLIAFGSNLPFAGLEDSQAVIRAGLQRLANRLDAELSVSALYQSEPVPPSDQPLYINGVALAIGAWNPQEIMSVLLEIERDFGRERSVANAARTLDLDMIAYGNRELDSEHLTLPHPRMHLRGFVLKPLCDVQDDWHHPKLDRSAKQLLAQVDISDLRLIVPPFRVPPES